MKIAYGFQVEDEHRWVAVDEDGEVYSFEEKPKLREAGYWIDDTGGDCSFLGGINTVTVDYKNSLIDLEENTMNTTPEVKERVMIGDTVTLRENYSGSLQDYVLTNTGEGECLLINKTDFVALRFQPICVDSSIGIHTDDLKDYAGLGNCFTMVSPVFKEVTYRKGAVFSQNRNDYILIHSEAHSFRLINLKNGNRMVEEARGSITGDVKHSEIARLFRGRSFKYLGQFPEVFTKSKE